MRRSPRSKSKSHSKKDKPRSSAFLLSLVNKYQVCPIAEHTYIQLLIIEHVTLYFSVSLSLSLFMRICVCVCAIFVCCVYLCLHLCRLSLYLRSLFLSPSLSVSLFLCLFLSPLQIQSVRPEDMELLESSTANTSLLDTTTASDSPHSEVCVCVCVCMFV